MGFDLRYGDCLKVMRGMSANSVDAIVTDPPYYKIKEEEWDRQWSTPQAFLAWLDEIAGEWQRILKPNGSLYCFASSKMAARVEVKLGERFNVINSIVWNKGGESGKDGAGKHRRASKELLRSYFPVTERIIFAEHSGADNIAKGENGYAAKCDELRGRIFDPLRRYLAGERDRAGVSNSQINNEWRKWKKSPNGGMTSHWFSPSQWELPTAESYQWLRETLSALNNGGEYLVREYDDLRNAHEALRAKYDDSRREYESLRRPFSVTPDVSYTDVWTFNVVQNYDGKHPCEKPLNLMRHIIKTSTRAEATVLDCFAGSCSVGVACVELGRNFIGIERDARYYERGLARLNACGVQPSIFYTQESDHA